MWAKESGTTALLIPLPTFFCLFFTTDGDRFCLMTASRTSHPASLLPRRDRLFEGPLFENAALLVLPSKKPNSELLSN